MKYKITKDEIRQMAIDWQRKASNKSMSYLEIIKEIQRFRILAKKYGLVREFKENGII